MNNLEKIKRELIRVRDDMEKMERDGRLLELTSKINDLCKEYLRLSDERKLESNNRTPVEALSVTHIPGKGTWIRILDF